MARNAVQNEKMRSDRQAQIRKAALRQFAVKGLYATKVKDIAGALGMAQGLVYHYYGSKEDIYIELITDALQKLNDAVMQLKSAPEPPHKKIALAIEEMLRVIATSEDFTQTCLLIAQATNSMEVHENARALIEAERDLPYREIAEIMALGQREKTIVEADPEDLSVLFWTTINGLAIYRATRADKPRLPAAGTLLRLFLTDQGLQDIKNTV